MRGSRPFRLLLAAGVLASAAACRGGDDDGAATTTPSALSAVPTTVSTRPADGRLTIGLLLPTTGPGAGLGQSLTDGALRAINEVNVAGGVRSAPVVVVSEDEGETTADAADAAQTLIDADVDAVIGPASSPDAAAIIGELTAHDVLTCSPTATSIALDDHPDRELFVRTAPSDSIQAVGLATLAEQTSRTTVAVAWVDDVYGRPFERAVSGALQARPSMDVVANVAFPADGSLDQAVAELVQARPGVIIVIGGPDTGWDLLTALAAAAGQDATFEQPDILVNDAMRRPSSTAVVTALPATFRSAIQGLSPVAFHTDDELSPYLANAFDCAMLIALAAEAVGTDDPTSMAAALNGLSARGGSCRVFEDCREALAPGRDADYDGLAQNFAVQIGEDGDPERARYDQFTFDDTGRDVTQRTITVTR